MDRLGRWYEAQTFREVFGQIADRTQHIPTLVATFEGVSIAGGVAQGRRGEILARVGDFYVKWFSKDY